MRLVFIPTIFVLSITLLFTSCEKDLVITGQYNEKMVLNGIAEVGLPISVELSKTRNVLDSEDEIDWVRNADIFLISNDNSYQERLKYDAEGVYRSAHIAKYSEKYKLEVIHPTFTDVEAVGVMPDEPEAIVRYLNEGPREKSSVFNIEIKNKDAQNFYIWEMVKVDSEVQEQSQVAIESTDSKTDNILPDNTQYYSKIFLQGSVSAEENITSSFIAQGVEESELVNTTVKLFTMNRDMYNYYRSLELYKNSQANIIEPIEIYSNVTNGLGIFGAVSESVIQIQY